jgi:hypothetical protein
MVRVLTSRPFHIYSCKLTYPMLATLGRTFVEMDILSRELSRIKPRPRDRMPYLNSRSVEPHSFRSPVRGSPIE